jgi:sarcosine oxidase subunit beta
VRVVVIGAGMVGLSLAYNLAKQGAEVIVIESRYPGSGLSGRAIGGVHSQWNNEHDIELAKRTRQILSRLSTELHFFIPFRRDGYMMLAANHEEMMELEKNAKLERSLGINVQNLSAEDIGKRYPFLDTSEFVGGTFSKGDGVVHPFSVVFGYWYGFEQHRGQVLKSATAIGLTAKEKRIEYVETDQGKIKADAFVIVAGSGTRQLLKTVDLDVPTKIIRHEMLATEPLKFFLKPMIQIRPKDVLINQSLRGEIICDIPRKDDRVTGAPVPTLEFLEDAATELTGLIPATAKVKVLRQWTGTIETMADAKPIVGSLGLDNLWVALADSGKSTMFAPALGEMLAENILTGHIEHGIEGLLTIPQAS